MKCFNTHTTKVFVPKYYCSVIHIFVHVKILRILCEPCVVLFYLNVFVGQQVIPKSEILRLGVLEQSKEEVIVQVGTGSLEV